MRWNTVRLCEEAGAPFDLIGWLEGLVGAPRGEAGIHPTGLPPVPELPAEVTVQVPGRRGQEPLTVRLVAQRTSPEALARTLKHLRRQASRKQSALDPRSEIAAAFVVLATSLPREAYPAYRLRRQIDPSTGSE